MDVERLHSWGLRAMRMVSVFLSLEPNHSRKKQRTKVLA